MDEQQQGQQVAATPELTTDREEVDRRSSLRFPITQEVRYRIFGRDTVEIGSGRTVNVSSSGVLFTTEHSLNPGDRLELSINWPAQLDHKRPLKLVTSGRVVRRHNGTAAMAIDRYEFRTQGIHGFT